MFADRAKIYIRSGKGGDGHVSFRRELYVPNGGPDGGDGGRGGDVIFEVDKGLNTLVDFRHKTKYKAQDGEEGGKKRCHGKDAKDLILKVPEGTVIREAETNKVIADMSGENQRQIILKGGKGGLGNMHFATSTMQVPKYAQPGKPAQELWVNLELKVIADVGLVGFPNVGKSTFLSRVTNAQPKIANYHFTTLSPNLGVVDLEGAKGFVIADIPGLIEGASEGVGLGHEFLRHVERTKMMIHVVDAAGIEGRDPVEDIYKINAELEAYNKEISMRPQVIAANKVDLIYSEDEDPIQRLRDEFEPKGIKVFPISGVTGEGLSDLLYYVNNELQKLDDKPIVFEQEYFPEEDQSELEQMIKGSFGGMGSYIAYNTKLKRSMISEPFEGTPAAKAGLKAGDILMEIDGKDLAGKNNAEVSQMLRGQAGTSFKLKIERPNVNGGRTPMEFTIVRESIQNPAIPYTAVLDNNIGYIGLSTFSGNPSKEFKKAFLDLKKQGATSLVIDLRSNGGGLLDEAVEIANYFLPRGKVIVTTKGKIKQASNTYKTLREPLDLDIPIAVLVNSGTASASEILSGSLQDLDRAVIVGNRTFGKGLVQVPRSLPYGGTMKVTTSKYYIPSGRCVQAIDYKHRNEDGSVGTIPDSLTKVFYTAAGREVRDGGGVMPDITIKQEKLPNILFYLVRDNLIFDYATQYCLKHPTIVAPEKFEVTDADYNDFKALVKKADFKYDQQSEKILKTLKEAAEFEGYMDDASEEFKVLEKKLNHNLDRDLDYFSTDIKKMIATEIIKRYYYQRGNIIQQLKDDDGLKEAMKILNDPVKYKEMLSAPVAKK